LTKSTDKVYKSLGIGFITTTLLQSSSLISVITISFISAGIIGLKAGIGIIFGANIGSTTTAWIIASLGLNFKVSALALPMLAFGIIFVFQKSPQLKGFGRILAGLGFFFLGIFFMKEGFDDYSGTINLAQYSVPGIKGLFIFTLIGILITVVLQSSAASMALILTALAVGQITYNNALALAIGANIGTTITAVLGALSANAAGKRLAGAHLIFNLFTGALALIFILPLGHFVNFLASTFNIAEDNYVIKLAIFHTLFNVLGVGIMLPFIDKMINFLEKIIVVKEDDLYKIDLPYYLNESILAYPQTALKALLDESKRLFENATFDIICHGINLHRADIKGDEKLKNVLKKSKEEMKVNIDKLYYQKVKTIYSKIIKYATLAQGSFALSEKGVESFTRIKIANRNIVEIIKDVHSLQNNVNTYVNSENKFIQKEYDRLRLKVSKVLREIYLLQISEIPELHLEKLEKLKHKAQKSDALIDGSLDYLIRDKKISSAMATSLANDSATVASITKRLIETAELLYIDSDTILRNSETDMLSNKGLEVEL
jgi:phosphate:Na+ symporter